MEAVNTHALKFYEKAPRDVVIAGRACYVCHRADDIVTFPVSIETEGILGLCSRCIKRAAKLVGLVDAKALKDENVRLSAENQAAGEALQAAQEVIAGLEKALTGKDRLAAASA